MKHNLKSISFILFIALFFVFPLFAEENTASSEWKIEDVINQESAGNFQISHHDEKWAVDEKNNGKIIGRSAITPMDTRGNYTPPLEYVGLRIAKNAK